MYVACRAGTQILYYSIVSFIPPVRDYLSREHSEYAEFTTWPLKTVQSALYSGCFSIKIKTYQVRIGDLQEIACFLHDEVTTKKPNPDSQSECSDIIKISPPTVPADLGESNNITDQSLTILLIIYCALATNYMYSTVLYSFMYTVGVLYQ